MRNVLFSIFMVSVCGYAWWRGGPDERAVATSYFGTAALTWFVAAPQPMRYGHFEVGIFAADLICYLALRGVAIRSERRWALWISGLAGAPLIMHLARYLVVRANDGIYSQAIVLWSYPILVMLLIATWRSRNLSQKIAA